MSDSFDNKALAIVPRSMTELQTMAEFLSKSDLLPKALRGKAPDVAMTIMAGQEMGFTPMASLRNFHVIEGRPVLSADGMVALALGSGHAKYFKPIKETAEEAVWETLRVGDDKPRSCTWTKQMAKDAGLNTKDNWRLYPRQMLAARAKSELARSVYPDVLAGCVSDIEHSDWNPPQRGEIIDADFTETPSENEPTPHEILALEHTENESQAKEMGPILAKLPKKWHALANEKYKARLKFHREQPKTVETEAEAKTEPAA